jgi:hypothetical protein
MFPSTLPAPLIDGYRLRPAEGGILRGMDGLARQRRRHVAGVDVAIGWNAAELGDFALLCGWLDTYGAAWFNITLDLGGGATTVTARLIGTWAAAKQGNIWRVTAQVEVRP